MHLSIPCCTHHVTSQYSRITYGAWLQGRARWQPFIKLSTTRLAGPTSRTSDCQSDYKDKNVGPIKAARTLLQPRTSLKSWSENKPNRQIGNEVICLRDSPQAAKKEAVYAGPRDSPGAPSARPSDHGSIKRLAQSPRFDIGGLEEPLPRLHCL